MGGFSLVRAGFRERERGREGGRKEGDLPGAMVMDVELTNVRLDWLGGRAVVFER